MGRMTMKVKNARGRTAEYKQSRAALRTIEMAVATVEDGIKRLGMLQDYLYRAHRAALGGFQAARHHSLLVRHLDWPAALGARVPHEHVDRSLTDREADKIVLWAGSAFEITGGMLTLSTLLDGWYGDLVRSAAEAARSAALKVTVWQHRASELILLLDQLCADERIAGPLVLAGARKKDDLTGPGGERWFAGAAAPDDDEEDDDEGITRHPIVNRRLH
jgi:hypothetical protein